MARSLSNATLKITREGRYASVFFDLCQKTSIDILSLVQEIQTLWKIIEEHPKLNLALLTPLVHPTVQEKILQKISTALGTPEILTNFLRFLIRQKRFADTPKIFEIMQTFFEKDVGLQKAIVVTADFLPKNEEKSLVEFTKKHCFEQSASHMEILFKVDPNLIAGYRIEREGTIFDASFAKQMILLKKTLGIMPSETSLEASSRMSL